MGVQAETLIHGWLVRGRQLALQPKVRLLLLSGALGAAGGLIGAAGGPALYQQGAMTLAAALTGYPVVRQAWGALRERQFSIPFLITVAAAGALWIGEPWEAMAVTFLYVLGSYLEEMTLDRTREALRTLVSLSPRTARVKRGDRLVLVPAEAVAAGETVVLLPGDRLAVDGVVTAGQAALNTAALTGEPLPVEAGPGAAVLGGSVCQGGYLEVTAQRVGADTAFSRLIHLVAEAQEQKPRVQRYLDRFARWYTPAVVGAAILLYLFTREAELALTFLVIGCPGALVVAAPVAVVAGLGTAARRGVLIKGGERLERIGQVDVVAFDKTGTLTQGRPQVTAIIPFTAGEERRLLSLAAAAEQRSEHHLAGAVLERARQAGVTPAPAGDWNLVAGLGAVARGPEGEILVGSRRLLASRGVALTQAEEEQVAGLEAEGATIALVALAGIAIGVLAITDPLRPDAAAMIAGLRQSGVQRTLMLTGDNPAAAKRVADRLGIDTVLAGLTPEEKVAAVRGLQDRGHVVAMVGDGVNDAPALAAASVSIAMGVSGTAVAIETADITLMGDRLDRIPQAIGQSRQIMQVVRQNVAIAVAVVLLLLAGVVGRMVFLSGGMLIHEASVLLVIANGMRLLRLAPAAAAEGLALQ